MLWKSTTLNEVNNDAHAQDCNLVVSHIERQCCEELSAVLGDQVERGSGHFSKVRTLTVALRYIGKLMKRRPRSASPSPPLRDMQETNEPGPHSCNHYQCPPQLQQCKEVKYDEIVHLQWDEQPQA